jgi:hypothetical protein
MKSRVTLNHLYLLARENEVEVWQGGVKIRYEISPVPFDDTPEYMRP